jgi:hypothetical protein
MKRFLFCVGAIAPFAVIWACGTETSVQVKVTPSPADATAVETGADAGASKLACGDASGLPKRALVVQGLQDTSELAVVNLETGAVDGRLSFEGAYGVTSSMGSDPYLLGGESDIVTRLDAREPWKAVARWNVRGDDGQDGGLPNANPVAVVQISCEKAYVLRFNRDRIAIVDPSAPQGGVPSRYIDLSGLKAAGDAAEIEMTSAVYVPEQRRVYVLLANADLTKFVTSGGTTKLLCSSLKPTIIAIDAETDQVVNLGGMGMGGGIRLEGYNPPLGSPLVYDAEQNRLIVLHAGCNAELGDGGAGDIIRRRVEQVSLSTGQVSTLLSLDSKTFPSSLAVASPQHAAVAFYFDGYLWDPRQTTLGAAISGGMDLIATDGRGAFVGTRQVYFDDGGTGPLEVVQVSAADAGDVKVVAQDPFSKKGGYVAGVEAFPPR